MLSTDGGRLGENQGGKAKTSLAVRMNSNGAQMTIIKANIYGFPTTCKHSTYSKLI